MKPSVGRIVHYVEGDGSHRAAIITRVRTATQVNLTIFGEDGTTRGNLSVFFDEQGSNFTWHWPEREPAA